MTKPVPPITWAAFAAYKAEMLKFMNHRVSYEGLRVRSEAWPITGDYTFVIDENTPVYVRDGVSYQVHNLDGDRVNVPNLAAAISSEEAFLNANITEAIALFVVEDGPTWLATNDFVPVGEEL
uniref:Uncharacterized protein n=1 Tax=viral metagenome TaxID=1070528 RepID=A0A6H1ZI70_9ZZZZ